MSTAIKEEDRRMCSRLKSINIYSTINSRGSDDLGYEGSLGSSSSANNSPYNTGYYGKEEFPSVYACPGVETTTTCCQQLLNSDRYNDRITPYNGKSHHQFNTNNNECTDYYNSRDESLISQSNHHPAKSHIKTATNTTHQLLPFDDRRKTLTEADCHDVHLESSQIYSQVTIASSLETCQKTGPDNKGYSDGGVNARRASWVIEESFKTETELVTPICFALPHLDQQGTTFIGREWLFREIAQTFKLTPNNTHSSDNGSARSIRFEDELDEQEDEDDNLIKGYVITGTQGTGKTALIKEILKNSPVFRNDIATSTYNNSAYLTDFSPVSPTPQFILSIREIQHHQTRGSLKNSEGLYGELGAPPSSKTGGDLKSTGVALGLYTPQLGRKPFQNNSPTASNDQKHPANSSCSSTPITERRLTNNYYGESSDPNALLHNNNNNNVKQLSASSRNKPSPESILRRKTSFLNASASFRVNNTRSPLHEHTYVTRGEIRQPVSIPSSPCQLSDMNSVKLNPIPNKHNNPNGQLSNELSPNVGENIGETSFTTNLLASETLKTLGSRVIAYHMCQSENAETHSIPRFIQNLAHQMYTSFGHLIKDSKWCNTIKNPFNSAPEIGENYIDTFYNEVACPLEKIGKMSFIKKPLVVILDNLSIIDSHQQRKGFHTSESFEQQAEKEALVNFILYSCQPLFPPWIKLLLTGTNSRNAASSINLPFPFKNLSHDPGYIFTSLDIGPLCSPPSSTANATTYSVTDNAIKEDLRDYICYRFERCPRMVYHNILGGVSAPDSSMTTAQGMNEVLSSRKAKATRSISSTPSETSSSSLDSSFTSHDSRPSKNAPKTTPRDYEQRLQAATMLPKLVDRLIELSTGSMSYLQHVCDLVEAGALVIKNASFKTLPRTIGECFSLYLNRAFPISAATGAKRGGFDMALATLLCCRAPLLEREAKDILAHHVAETQREYCTYSRISRNEKSHPSTIDFLNCSPNSLDKSFDFGSDLGDPTTTGLTASESIAPENFEGKHPTQVVEEIMSHLRAHRIILTYIDGRVYFIDHLFREWLVQEWHLKFRLSKGWKIGHEIIANYMMSNIKNAQNPASTLYEAVTYYTLMDDESLDEAKSVATIRLNATVKLINQAFLLPKNLKNPSINANRLLLKAGANPNSFMRISRRGSMAQSTCTVLHWAISHPKFAKFAELLIQMGADPYMCVKRGGPNCISHAIECGNIVILRYIRAVNSPKFESNLWYTDKSDFAALDYAIIHDQLEIVDFLTGTCLSATASDLDEHSKRIQKCFVLACALNNLEACKIILRYYKLHAYQPANLCNRLISPLCAAILGTSVIDIINLPGHYFKDADRRPLITFLIEEANATVNGSTQNVHDVNTDLTNPLTCAAIMGSSDVIQLLLKLWEGARPEALINARDGSTGKTALIYASQNGHLECVKLLGKAGACLSQTDANGWSALHWASYNGHYDVAQSLTKTDKCQLMTYNRERRTPLHLAALRGHPRLVENFVESNDDSAINLLDVHGLSVLDLALHGYIHELNDQLKPYKILSLVEDNSINNINNNNNLAIFEQNFAGCMQQKQGDTSRNKSRDYLNVVTTLLNKGANIRTNAWRVMSATLNTLNKFIISNIQKPNSQSNSDNNNCNNIINNDDEELLGQVKRAYKAVIALQKLFLVKILQDANALAKSPQISLKDAIYRYEYALKKFPTKEGLLQPETYHEDVSDSSRSRSTPNSYKKLHSEICNDPEIWSSLEELKISTYLNLCRCALYQQNYTRAIENVTKALDIHPQNLEAHYMKAMIVKQQSQNYINTENHNKNTPPTIQNSPECIENMTKSQKFIYPVA